MSARLAALLAALLFAAPLRAGFDPPFPYPDRTFTLGDVLKIAPAALNMNLVVKGSVPTNKRLTYTFRDMTCRQALDLVVELEELQLVEFRPGIWIIAPRREKIGGAALATRSFRLTHTTPEKVIAFFKANPVLAAQVDLDRMSAAPDGRTLVVIGSPSQLGVVAQQLGNVDAPSGRRPVVLPLSFLSREELQAALASLPPETTGGLTPRELAFLPNGQGVAVAGTPDQVEKMRQLIALLDVAPETVQIGVTSATASATRTRRVGLDTTTGPGSSQIGGLTIPQFGATALYDVSNQSSAGSGTLWITTLSGSPARIGLEQIFVVPVRTTVLGPGGQASSTSSANEVPVGLALEVLPRVTGRAVLVEVRLTDSQPTRISDIGVDRSQQALLTRALVPRGGSIHIGGFRQALQSSDRPGALQLLNALSSRTQDLGIVLTVR